MSDDGRKDLSQKSTSFSNETVVVNGPALDYPLSSLSESFEGATFPPAGWIKLNPDGGTGWASITAGTTPLPGWNGGVATVPTGGGTKTAYSSWNTGGPTANDQWIVTPQITNVQPGDSLKFWLRKPGYCNAYLDHFDVKISTTTPVVASFTTTVIATTSPANSPDTNWMEYKFRLGNFVTAGANIYIGFREWVLDNNADGSAYQLDLVSVVAGSTPPPTMVDPTNMCQYTSASVWSNLWGHGSDNLGDTLYVAGGSAAGSGTTTLNRYNINSNTMGTDGAPIPESKAGHSFTKCGSSLYLIGGSTAVSTGGTTCYKYTPSTGTWTSIAPLPVALSGHNAVNWGDSVIFVVSGGWATYSTSVYAYRPATNTWITSTSLPAGTGRRSAACGLTNGKIFLSCGYSGTFRGDLVIGTIGADASTITWATGPVVPFLGGKTGTSRPGGTAVNGKFYLITGEITPVTSAFHDTIYIFNSATSTWSNIKGGRGPQAASNYWSAISYKVMGSGNIKIFIPGGSITGGIGQLCCLQVPACTVTGVENNSHIPTTYSLSQNYPNPFNPVTKISFGIPKSGLVSLKVYDVLGKEVVTLVNEVKNPGSYIVDFNGASLSSGIYFYRLETNGFTSVKKMMLIK
ncbi:MAG: choice-of-anchor J domain-containing protein, partial [Ignavibacteriae bacterium]|nr:choice-of-anchor J domain-containing protein [Ignavibacteriota bacterium]